MEEKKEISQESFIKKISIQLYLIRKDIEKLKIENVKDRETIEKKITSIDKSILKYFDVKLSEKTKISAIELLNILK